MKLPFRKKPSAEPTPPPLVDGVCDGGRCTVALAGLSRRYGRCIRCGRRWGSMPGGSPLEELHGNMLLGFTIQPPEDEAGRSG